MTEVTHATIAVFDVDLDREDDQRIALERFIVPSVRQAPGFVNGTWMLDREAAESIAVVTFVGAAAASDFVESVRANESNRRAAGLVLRAIRVVEVAAST
ncbi:MAG: hypothetical protein QOE63_1853 [Acidimicrobiaceae bacterium]|jgi:hypothetical protein